MSIITKWVEEQLKEINIMAEPLNEETFNAWRKTYLMEAIMGIRYGQSFCNHFGIEDNILFYMKDVAAAHFYIRENYLQGKSNDKETKPGPV